jgi:histone-lysine N-methyltransferase SETMAR
MGKVSGTMGMCVSGIVCLMGEGQMCTMKCNLDAPLHLLHDNTRPHTAEKMTKLLEKFGWETFDHPPYSPDLAPSDLYIFPKMKEFLGSKQMATDEEAKETVTDWLNGLAADFCNKGIVKLVQHLGRCLNRNGDYIEK